MLYYSDDNLIKGLLVLLQYGADSSNLLVFKDSIGNNYGGCK